jgi:ribosomal protein L5
MTDRLKGVVVAFDHDIRVDDAEQIIAAIRMIRRVADVQPVVADANAEIAELRANAKWRDKLGALIYEDITGRKRGNDG